MELHIRLTGSGDDCNVFRPGSILQGVVDIDNIFPLPATAVRLSFKGRAFVHWTEQNVRGPGEPRYKDTHHYSAREEYFDHSMLIFGKASSEMSEKCYLYLPAGRYSYPFQFQLPTSLPSSFEGEHGYIRYWVKTTVEKGRSITHVTKLPFTVVCPLDLNAIPEVSTPVQETKEKKLCCFCCLSGPIRGLICLRKRGFVPGETIRFGAEISNMSSRKMGSSSVELKMTTIFHTLTKSRSVTRQIAKVKRPSLGKGESDVWSSDHLSVPSLPPSYLLGCGIIEVKYTIELRVDPVGPAFDLTIPLDVVIGTIPLQLHIQDNVSHHSGQTYQSAASHRHPIGVPVLPVQGGHLICNPAHINQMPNQIPPSRTSGSQLSVRSSSAPSTSSTLSLHHQNIAEGRKDEEYWRRKNTDEIEAELGTTLGRNRDLRTMFDTFRKSPFLPSDILSEEKHADKVSAVYAESWFGKVNIRDDDDIEETRGQLRYAPSYPFYRWGKT